MNSSSPPNSEPSNLGFLRLAPDADKAERLATLIRRYEHQSQKAQSILLEAYELDTTAMDRHYPLLRKVNVPRPKDTTTSNFSTLEVALLVQTSPSRHRPKPSPSLTDHGDSRYQPQHPGYRSALPQAALDKAAGRSRDAGAPKPWKDGK